MASFRSASKQAERAVARVLAIGTPRHGNRDDGRIHSLRTAANYKQALTNYAEWRSERQMKGGIDHTTRDQALQYLRDRAAVVGQKQLDLDRQALRVLPNLRGVEIERIKTEVTRIGLADVSRAYTEAQVTIIAGHQAPHNALATEIAHAAGLRAHELLTLQPAADRPASSHREWSPDRLVGRDGSLYTVQGKGGLIREVLLPHDLADRLEATRLAAPRRSQSTRRLPPRWRRTIWAPAATGPT